MIKESLAQPGTTVQVGADMWRIRVPTPFPGLPSLNVYAVCETDGSVTLVDCGIDCPEGLETLAEGLAVLDKTVSHIDRIIITHGHIDHWGMLPRLLQHTDFTLCMSEHYTTEAWSYTAPEEHSALIRSILCEHGTPPSILEQMFVAPSLMPSYFPDGVPAPDVIIRDGDKVPIGSRVYEAVWTPGHAHSHLVFFHEASAELISGDNILPTITPHIGYDGRIGNPLGDYLLSLKRIKKLTAGVTFPAHGGTISDGTQRSVDIRTHHEDRLTKMQSQLQNAPKSAWEVMKVSFQRELMPFQQRLALSETVAHLEALCKNGNVHRVENDIILYTASLP